MANRAYLSTTNRDTIFPGVADPDFDSELQTVAQSGNCVPILWLGLFRPEDMRSQEFEVQGEVITGVGPVATIASALRRLQECQKWLEEMFGGGLSEYCDMLSDAVSSTGLKYVTMELEEIACMVDPERFYDDVRGALRALSGEESIPFGREKLIRLSGIAPDAVIPPARLLLDAGPITDDQIEIHARLIGAKWLRKVPWE